MKTLILSIFLVMAGCTPLINVSINNGGDSSKQSIRGESDQAPSTTTSAAIPVSIGAKPNSSGTVNK